MQLVCNASPLIFLAKIDLIHVLPKMCETLYVPVGVYHEIKGQNDVASQWIEQNKNSYVIKIDSIPKIIESWDLGKGETEVIACAHSNKDLLAALDDKVARNCAASLGIDVIGTIGLIITANRKGQVDKPVTYLEKLKKTGFRISDDLFQHAVYLVSH
jgi:predicted nucleic acid-binding protein